MGFLYKEVLDILLLDSRKTSNNGSLFLCLCSYVRLRIEYFFSNLVLRLAISFLFSVEIQKIYHLHSRDIFSV